MRTRPDIIRSVNLSSGRVDIDEAGYLVDPSSWTREFALRVAEQEGLTMSDPHWFVIAFMRRYLDDHGVAADARFVLRFLGEELGLGKREAKRALFELFPHGYVKQACKMAGMRQPRAWSTG